MRGSRFVTPRVRPKKKRARYVFDGAMPDVYQPRAKFGERYPLVVTDWSATRLHFTNELTGRYAVAWCGLAHFYPTAASYTTTFRLREKFCGVCATTHGDPSGRRVAEALAYLGRAIGDFVARPRRRHR